MADPNTQIDWWIAQTWQEAQGGADSDALVAWLHDNGLTAVSSYTILQAALSCSSEEAKQMVFGHPAWAGADAETDLSGAEYTSDTLEPEPEPDATFGLDDWADEIEEDEPVYGEPGYEPPPTVSPTRPAAQDGEAPPQRTMLLDAYAEMQEDEADGDSTNFDTPEEPLSDADDVALVEEADTEESPELVAEMPAGTESEEEAFFEAEDFDEDGPEVDADQVFEMDPGWEAEPAPAKPAPVASMLPTSSPAPHAEPATQPIAETPADIPSPATAIERESRPAPTPSSAPAAPPPILRMPPATPAERAATFAAAFGKKPSSPPPTGGASSAAPNGGPPSNDTGPAAHAETAPAQTPAEPPQPAHYAAPTPTPLELEPFPEFEAPASVSSAEPLFTATVTRDPASAPPLFPPKPEPSADTGQADEPETEDQLDEDHEAGSETETPDTEPAQGPEATIAATSGEYPAEPDSAEATAEIPAGAIAEDASSMDFDDVEPEADDFDAAHEDRDENDFGEQQALEEDELPAIDWEEELPDLGIEEPEESAESDDDENEVGNAGQPVIEDEPEHPRKRLLLDPDEEEPHQAGTEEEPEDLAAAAKNLGINFRGGDSEDAGVDPELSKAAKELGISFRDEGGSAGTSDEETAREAQKLGISFREETTTGKTPKPLMVKYLPMFLGLIVIFFLLLIGATFSGSIIDWLKN